MPGIINAAVSTPIPRIISLLDIRIIDNSTSIATIRYDWIVFVSYVVLYGIA